MRQSATVSSPIEHALQPSIAGIRVPSTPWRGALAHSLARLLATPPRGAQNFRRTVGFGALHGARLAANATSVKPKFEGFARTYPLPCTFLQLRLDAPIVRTLGWLLLELHLEGVHFDAVMGLAANLRGLADEKPDHRLANTIWECDGLSHLVRKMDFLAAQSTAPGVITGLSTFDASWRKELRGICLRLLGHSMPAEWDEEGDSDFPSEPLGDPATSLPDPLDDEDTEELAGTPYVSLTPSSSADTANKAHEERCIAWAETLHRRSSPEVHRSPDSILPACLVKAERDKLIFAGRQAITRTDVQKAEHCLLHLLALEAGLTDAEARGAVLARVTFGGVVAIDIRNRCLRRPEIRPSGAFEPKENKAGWLVTGGDTLSPLSNQTLGVAAALLRLRSRQARRTGTATSHLLVADSDGAIAHPVREAIRVTRSIAALTAGAYRLRLAAALTEILGSDAAQIAFGDSFGLSTAPTYYSSFIAADIAGALAQSSGSITGVNLPHARCIVSGKHALGSRVRPVVLPFKEAWQSVGVSLLPRRGRPSEADALVRWRAQRDSLAVQLMLATGCRPTKALARIRIDDFIPGAALVVLQDKATDPAHLTRLACTGYHFVGSLRSFLDTIRRASRDVSRPEARALAKRILAGDANLFDIPGARGAPEPLDLSELRSRLPEIWRIRPNLHRHALCHDLIAAGIDPELRFFQMGWLIAGAHATSDESPRSPIELGVELAPMIDAWMLRAGWCETVEARDLGDGAVEDSKDWVAVAAKHHRTGEAAFKKLRSDLRERRAEVRPRVHAKLAERMAELLPAFEFTTRKSGIRLALRPSLNIDEPPVVDKEVVDRVLESFSRPLELYVARWELSRTLIAGNKARLCRAQIPRVQSLALSTLPSPVAIGSGAAIAEVARFRNAITDAAGRMHGDDNDFKEQLARFAVWAVASFTPYRRLPDAVAIVRGATQAQQSRCEPWLLRVPMGSGHVCLSGSPALLLSRLLRTEGGLDVLANLSGTTESLGETVLDLIPETSAKRSTTVCADAALRMEAALQIAGELELSGPARLVMRGSVAPATVTATRAVTAADGMSIESALPGLTAAEDDDEDVDVIYRLAKSNPAHRPTSQIRDLMQMLDPDYSGMVGNKPAASGAARKRQLRPLIEQRLVDLGSRPTLSMLFLQYVLHRMSPGSTGGELKLSTIHKIYHRIAPMLAGIAAHLDMTEVPPKQLTGVLLAALHRCKRRDRSDVFEELRRFLKFASTACAIAEADWEMLCQEAGVRFIGSDPAIVTNQEADRVLDQLARNLEGIDNNMLDPRERRVRELQLVAELVVEATGARPRSVHGLTLGDMHFLSDGDWIHLHARGRYGSIKTPTSAGFVRLQGHGWSLQAQWVQQLRARARAAYPDTATEHIPLFQVPGEPLGVRYRISEVFGRIGELIRWSTNHAAGRTYWLRKRRIQLRHRAWLINPSSRTRHVLRALRESGHAGLSTPIASYLADTLTYLDPLKADQPLSADRATALSGLTRAAVDQRWRRLEAGCASDQSLPPEKRIGALLKLPIQDRLEPEVARPPAYRPLIAGFAWRAVEAVLAELAEGSDLETVCEAHGVTTFGAERIKIAISNFQIRSGLELGLTRSRLHRPRATPLFLACMGLVDREDRRVSMLARDWVSLARAWPVLNGCALLCPNAINAFRSIASEFAIPITEKADQRGPTILVLDTPDSSAHYGTWQSLRWAMTVAWVAENSRSSF